MRVLIFGDSTAQGYYDLEQGGWFNPGIDELRWTNERIRLFDGVLKQFTEEHGASFVPVFEAFVGRQLQGEQLCADGLHPNEAGHKLIYELAKSVIEPIISSKPAKT